MAITHIEKPNYTLISVADMVFIRHQAKPFVQKTKALIKKGVNRFVVDLSNCEYISSEGLGAIAELWHSCVEKDKGSVAVVCKDDGQNEVRYLFDIIGLSRLMTGQLFSNLREAEAHMESTKNP